MQISLCLYFLHADTLDLLVTDKFLKEGIIHFFCLIRQLAQTYNLRSLALCCVSYSVSLCFFVTLPLEIPQKIGNFCSGNCASWLLATPLIILRPKTNHGNCFFFITLGNSTSMSLDPWFFHMLFLQPTPGNLMSSTLNPPPRHVSLCLHSFLKQCSS